MEYENIREEELKNKVAQDYFYLYDCTQIIGNIDFCVSFHQTNQGLYNHESLLWAEAKKGSSDIYKSIAQLVLTIGTVRTFDKYLPPPMLGAFDGEKIAFIPYNDIQEVFYINDFNWKVTPSNYATKEFELIHNKVKEIIDNNSMLFYYRKDDKELRKFIKDNFVIGKFGVTKTKIDKNNFIAIYGKWLQSVKPTISVNWEVAKKSQIIDGDFYLADLLSHENFTLKEKLFVLLRHDHYEIDREINEAGLYSKLETGFTDEQKAHIQFWNKYERPPKEEYWDYIVTRRDLLVPQDVRERKGSFFTPQIWVELSQKYLADALGEDWQDEYYIWDCAAGTGNLLTGLTNKYHIWASTLDKQDVEVMRDRADNGTNLLYDHVFQFDFLNDDFAKLPKSLQKIINDPEERKKLVIYINPPYAEATSATTVVGTGKNKTGVATSHKPNLIYKERIGNASNEIFALFMANIYEKIPNCILALFSKLKFIQGTNFINFREFFKAEYLAGFIVPADTFDNVRGSFPIGFTVWNTGVHKNIDKIRTDVYDRKGANLTSKIFYGNLPQSINKWISQYYEFNNIQRLGMLSTRGNDFQNQRYVYLDTIIENNTHDTKVNISLKNIIPISVYFAVRHCIKSTWLNDRDQFLFPNNKWKKDKEFQNDCLAYTLFHGQNRISSKDGTNHWIPFTEQEVNARDRFDSHFMNNFINGNIEPEKKAGLFKISEPYCDYAAELIFSPEAKAVFDAGRELWKYYHSQKFSSNVGIAKGINNYNVNASLYDIREHFQRRNENGKMHNKSADLNYNRLINELREKQNELAEKIEPKIYQYGFLKV